MIEQLRRFLLTPFGKVLTAVVCLALLGFGVYSVKGFLKGETPDSAFTRMYIDTETGKAFGHEIQLGDTVPLLAPSGKQTGMPAEACYWTKDGQPKSTPTWVLLNIEKNPPDPSPTFCPDCGRLVVGHNPPPVAGGSPPPTREEWMAAHARDK